MEPVPVAEREIMNDRRDGLPTDRRPRGRWRAYLPLALITFLGISISLAAFVIVQGWENARVQVELERHADGHAKSL